jgi:hypothetical protein
MKSRLLLSGVLALAIAGVATANLLTNPGFEVGPAGGASPDGWWKYNEAGQENWAAQTGTNGMAFWSWSNGTYGGFGQDVVRNTGVGDVMTFSIYGLAEAQFQSSSSEVWLKLEIWTNGASAYTTQYSLDVYGGLTAAPNTWNQYTLIVTNQIANVTLIKPIVGGGGFTNVGGSQAVKWDNADFTVIPEPVSAMLLGLGLFGGFWFRRILRKK